jgi:hypothetical protein
MKKVKRIGDKLLINEVYKSAIQMSQIIALNTQDGGIEIFLIGGQRLWLSCSEETANTIFWIYELYCKEVEL